MFSAIDFPRCERRAALWARAVLAAAVLLVSLPGGALGGGEAAAPGAAHGSQPQVVLGPDPAWPLESLNLDRWGEGDGLPQNFVTSLAQTPDGFLWAGTERGLVRFDGTRFTVFTAPEEEGLPSSWVSALHAAADGTLWLGTGDGELVRFRDGFFETVLDEFLGGGPVHAIEEDAGGDLWLASEGSELVRVDPAAAGGTGARRYTPEDGLSGESVSALTAGPDGAIWVGSGGVVDRVDPISDQVEAAAVRLEPGAAAGALLVDSHGAVWVGTLGSGLHRSPGAGATAEPVPSHEALDNAFVTVLLEDAHGALWVGTGGGGVFRRWDGRVERAPSRPHTPTHLVEDLLEDREGNIWMGLTGVGLARLREGLFDNHGMPEGLSMDVALGVRQMEDGSVWVATPGQGVNRIGDQGVETFRAADGLGSDFAMTVAEGPAGGAWVGTVGGGVSRIAGGRVRTFDTDDGLLADQVSVVEWDREGRLWLGFQGAGLQVWEGTPAEALVAEKGVGPGDGLPHPVITTVREAAGGGMWVGTRGGLARVNVDGNGPGGLEVTATFRVEDGLPHGLVTGLHRDADGGLWVSTMGGLARVRDGDVYAFGQGDGFPELETMGLTEDGDGDLWLGTGQGILRVPRDQLDAVAEDLREEVEVERFGRPEGLRSEEANGAVHPAAWRGDDGAVWIPTMGGATRVDPDRGDRGMLEPIPVLETLAAGGRRFGAHEPASLPVGLRTLEFRYSAPTFVAPERVRLRYRLDGFDEEWEEVEGRRDARYTEVPPGEYTFRVEASDRQGNWTGREAALTVEVPPRAHERPAVQAAGLLLLAVLLGAGYRMRIRRSRQREEELLKLVEERERALNALREREQELRQAQKMEAVGRLAGGIAHDFNNLLSVVGLNARLAAESVEGDSPARHELDEAIRAADRAAELTRQLLQFSRRQLHRPAPVELNEIVRDVEQMLRRLIRADIELETRLADDLPTVRTDRGGVEQILVNLIVNARDAMPEGGRVIIATYPGVPDPEAEAPALRGPHAILTVEDTGEGMDEQTRSHAFEPFFTTKGVGEGSGLGLASVYGIVQQNRGHVDLWSAPGTGTVFRIYLPGDEGADTPDPRAS